MIRWTDPCVLQLISIIVWTDPCVLQVISIIVWKDPCALQVISIIVWADPCVLQMISFCFKQIPAFYILSFMNRSLRFTSDFYYCLNRSHRLTSDLYCLFEQIPSFYKRFLLIFEQIPASTSDFYYVLMFWESLRFTIAQGGGSPPPRSWYIKKKNACDRPDTHYVRVNNNSNWRLSPKGTPEAIFRGIRFVATVARRKHSLLLWDGPVSLSILFFFA